MKKESNATLLIDLSASMIRFLLVKEFEQLKHAGPILDRPVVEFHRSAPRKATNIWIVTAIRWALERFDLKPCPLTILISLPAPVADEEIAIAKPEGWSFSRPQLTSELTGAGWPVTRLEVINDMFALSLSLPAMLEAGLSEPMEPGGSRRRYDHPLLVACARPDLGAMGLVPIPLSGEAGSNDPAMWLPVLSEPGGLSLAAATASATGAKLKKTLAILTQGLRYSEAGLSTAHDFLGPAAVSAAYRLLGGHGEGVPAEEIAMARNKPAAETMEAWSFMFGLWVRSLALAFGARNSIYLSGTTTLTFFNESPNKAINKAAFIDAFTIAGPVQNYLREIEVNLIKHQSPYLEGLKMMVETTDDRRVKRG